MYLGNWSVSENQLTIATLHGDGLRAKPDSTDDDARYLWERLSFEHMCPNPISYEGTPQNLLEFCINLI